jgi:hypothetical protein
MWKNSKPTRSALPRVHRFLTTTNPVDSANCADFTSVPGFRVGKLSLLAGDPGVFQMSFDTFLEKMIDLQQQRSEQKQNRMRGSPHWEP